MPRPSHPIPKRGSRDAWFEREGHAERVLSVLRTGTPDQREIAATTLAAFEVSRAEPALIACLEYPAHTVREACARALGRCGGERAVEPLIDAGMAQRIAIASVRDALSTLPESATKPIAAATRHDAGIVRALAARELGNRRGHDSALIAALADPETQVRVQAVLALAERSSTDDIAREALMTRTHDPEPSVRAALCSVLRSCGTDGAQCLRQLSRDSDEWVARSAEVALSCSVATSRRALNSY
ncbi:MAG: HEAT repeat domain-containing protein [Thermoleophilia bacterium]|nr:HEAT repeat domain-containing protein [Thermoleophilia bacterium]